MAAAATEGAYYNQLMYLADLFRSAGLNSRLFPYLMAQVMHETGNLTSNLAQNYNNLSGITYVHQLAANGKQGVYATYANVKDWARDYARVLNLSPGKPANAVSAQDFHNRLLQNNYFGTRTAGSPADLQYIHGFNAMLKKINLVLSHAVALGEKYKSGELTTYTTDAKSLAPGDVKAANAKFAVEEKAHVALQWAQDHPLAAAGIGAGVIILISKIFSR